MQDNWTHRRRSLASAAAAASLLALCASPAFAAPPYKAAGAAPLGDPPVWDYAVADPAGGRVYVAHGDRLAVIDARTGKVIGNVEGIRGGAHGAAISHATNQGFTDDGRNGLALAFDLKTLAIEKRIPAAIDADAIAQDPVSGHVFITEGDPATVTVVDPKTDRVVATINVGEKMEYAVGADDAVFMAGVDKRDLLKVDARTNAVVARWPTPDCEAPHGLAMDARTHRAFMGCKNSKMMVVDTQTGKVVSELAIGRGNDAVAFDPKRGRVFAANGRDGTVSVYQEVTPDNYRVLGEIKTVASGRTLTVDPVTGRLFVPVADIDPNSPRGQRPHMLPDSARVLIFEPVG